MAGAPTKYKEEYNEQAYKLCLLGHTDAELAEYFEVEEKTINNWKSTHPEFLQSVTRGKTMADADVAQGFYKRAVGYRYIEETFEKVDNKVNLEFASAEMIVQDCYKKKIVTKEIPPDAGAALNWLKNRQKGKWRDKTEVDQNIKGIDWQNLEMDLGL